MAQPPNAAAAAAAVARQLVASATLQTPVYFYGIPGKDTHTPLEFLHEILVRATANTSLDDDKKCILFIASYFRCKAYYRWEGVSSDAAAHPVLDGTIAAFKTVFSARFHIVEFKTKAYDIRDILNQPVSYTHLTLPTTPYV